jgi:8-oxo-dGTP diphosphatase
MNPAINDIYGNKVRVRVCGICWRDGKLLMVNHKGMKAGEFWAPPGGGLMFAESAGTCLRREILEETGLEVDKERFMFACEFIQDQLHAIELFFEVSITGGKLARGHDPELPIIEDVRFLSPSEINNLPRTSRHGIFSQIRSPEQLTTLTGFFRI